MNSHQCNISANCFNTPGSYRCNCLAGFVGNNSFCQDVDECAQDSHDCHAYAFCHNTAGSYNCSCQHGYYGNGYNCTDIDECSLQLDRCHSNASCLNVPGTFNCTCKPGFTGNGSSCEDVDECLIGANSGLTGNGSSCTELDECHQATGICHGQAVCSNTLGSFVCTCKAGFTGNGSDCVDINECELGVNICHINSSCVNSNGSHSCICLPGYTGDDRECSDINECALDVYPCDKNVTCRNTPGSFKCECSFVCQCQTGFSGDGYNCTGMFYSLEGAPLVEILGFLTHSRGWCSNTYVESRPVLVKRSGQKKFSTSRFQAQLGQSPNFPLFRDRTKAQHVKGEFGCTDLSCISRNKLRKSAWQRNMSNNRVMQAVR